MLRALLALLLFIVVGASQAMAHSQSYGFVNLTHSGDRVSGTVALAVRDLDVIHDLDQNRDATITWGEFRTRENDIARALLADITVSAGNTPCALTPRPAMIDRRGGETYLMLPFDGACGAGAIAIAYNLLFDADAQHRGLVNLTTEAGTRSFVMTPSSRNITVAVAETGIALFLTWVKHGIDHILIGYDHILFVLTLLLGAAAIDRKQSMGALLAQITWVVTAFTLSHSATLALAALNIIKVPVALAEALIAVTIAVAALNNIRPVFTRRVWLLALLFGLVHGVGFANVLQELGLPHGTLVMSLLAFNLGVELGQLLIVFAAIPAVLLLARWQLGPNALVAANLATITIAVMWFSDRAFGTEFMYF